MGWWIVLGILILLAVLPLGAAVRYDADGVAVKVIAGPIRIGIIPGKKKKKKEKPEQKPKEKKKSQPKPKPDAQPKEKKKGGSVTDFLPLVKTALDFLGCFRRKLRVNRLEMKLVMAGGDPAALGINYGRAWAALGNLQPLLERVFVIKKRSLDIACDFEASETTVTAALDLTITLGRLVGMLVFYGCKLLLQFISIQNKRKGGMKNEPESS